MKYNKWLAGAVIGTLLSAGLFAGCGNQDGQTQQTVKVNTFKVYSSDTPIQREYTGTVTALQEVPVRSRVSGTVMEKYIEGGQKVTQGQPLYRIDSRNYESTLASAKADAARAAATYENSKTDLSRYEQLIASGAVSQQTYDNQATATSQYKAALDAAESQVQIAEDNLNDTVVTAPYDGTLSMDDVNVGTYATAGTTSLVTIYSSDPIYVTFDMSESEYVELAKKSGGTSALGDALKIRLSDGSYYDETGKIVQVNPTMTGGQISMKAAFPNPNNVLIPGMYATVVSDAQVAANSILVPTQAISPLLNKNMVDVVVDGKVVQKSITTAGTYGIFTIVTSGLNPGDEVIVAGQDKVTTGQQVNAEEVTKESLEKAATDAAKANEPAK